MPNSGMSSHWHTCASLRRSTSTIRTRTGSASAFATRAIRSASRAESIPADGAQQSDRGGTGRENGKCGGGHINERFCDPLGTLACRSRHRGRPPAAGGARGGSEARGAKRRPGRVGFAAVVGTWRDLVGLCVTRSRHVAGRGKRGPLPGPRGPRSTPSSPPFPTLRAPGAPRDPGPGLGRPPRVRRTL